MVYFIPFQKYGETRPYYTTNVDVYCHYVLLLLWISVSTRRAHGKRACFNESRMCDVIYYITSSFQEKGYIRN